MLFIFIDSGADVEPSKKQELWKTASLDRNTQLNQGQVVKRYTRWLYMPVSTPLCYFIQLFYLLDWILAAAVRTFALSGEPCDKMATSPVWC